MKPRYHGSLRTASILSVLFVSFLNFVPATAQEVVPAEKFLEVFGVADEEMDRLIAVEKPPTVTITINFDTDSAEIMGTHNTSQLDQLGKALQSDKLKKRIFSIEGHTDSRGSTAYNLKLSQRRSQSVVDYLVTKFGVGEDNLNANGQGEFFLLDKADTPEAHAKNRRVEIVLNGSVVD